MNHRIYAQQNRLSRNASHSYLTQRQNSKYSNRATKVKLNNEFTTTNDIADKIWPYEFVTKAQETRDFRQNTPLKGYGMLYKPDPRRSDEFKRVKAEPRRPFIPTHIDKLSENNDPIPTVSDVVSSPKQQNDDAMAKLKEMTERNLLLSKMTLNNDPQRNNSPVASSEQGFSRDSNIAV